MAPTTNDQAPIVSELMPAMAGRVPTNVPSKPINTSASATMIVGILGAKFIRPPIASDPGQERAGDEQRVTGKEEEPGNLGGHLDVGTDRRLDEVERLVDEVEGKTVAESPTAMSASAMTTVTSLGGFGCSTSKG